MFFSRGPNKIQNLYTYKDSYEEYVKGVDENSPYNISYDEYVIICRKFYKAVMNEILEKGYVFKLPYNMGKIFVDKKKMKITETKKGLGIDWEMTNKCGKVIYHLNEHSRGFKYMFTWQKFTHSMKNKNFYRFVPSRTNKRKLAKLIKSGNYDYFEHY